MKRSSCGSVLQQLFKIGRFHHDQIRIFRLVHLLRVESGSNRLRAEAAFQLSEKTDFDGAHRYAPPLGATSNTSIVRASRSIVYDTRQSPTRIRNPPAMPFSGLTLLLGAKGSAAIRSTATVISPAFAGCMRRKIFTASRR